MEALIYLVAECDSVYTLAAYALLLSCICAVIRMVVPYIYKTICKICSLLRSYSMIRTKANGVTASFEAELQR